MANGATDDRTESRAEAGSEAEVSDLQAGKRFQSTKVNSFSEWADEILPDFQKEVCYSPFHPCIGDRIRPHGL